MLSRRALLIYLPAATLAGSYALNAFAADKTITIGINQYFRCCRTSAHNSSMNELSRRSRASLSKSCSWRMSISVH